MMTTNGAQGVVPGLAAEKVQRRPVRPSGGR